MQSAQYEETFLLRLGDLSEQVQDQIKQVTKNYAISVVINDVPVGSGTLVQIDGHYGLLTAEHVVRHPTRPDLHLDNTAFDGPKLLLPPAEFPGGKPIDSMALRVFTTKRKSDEFGPDLAFIALPNSPLLSELKARRSFYPLARNIRTKKKEALRDTGFVAFCGFPASLRKNQGPSLGFSAVQGIFGFAFITGPEKYERRGSLDYFELGIGRSETRDVGDSFGGVSGGGVWRVPVYRKKGDPEGSETIGALTFTGVAFYEENHLPAGRFFVRAHGPRSVFGKFLSDIRVQLMREEK